MNKTKVLWAAGIGLATLILAVSNLRAATDEKINAQLNNIADMLEKSDAAGAKKAAKVIADDKDFDLELVMWAFKLREIKKKPVGIGVGNMPAVLKPEQDGIEIKIELIASSGITPDALKKEAAALARTGYVVSAVGHVTDAKRPEKDVGKAKVKDWIDWSDGLMKAGAEFTAAAKAENAGDLKKAANKIKQNCDSCHTVFK